MNPFIKMELLYQHKLMWDGNKSIPHFCHKDKTNNVFFIQRNDIMNLKEFNVNYEL